MKSFEIFINDNFFFEKKKSLLEICGKRGLSNEAKSLFRTMTSSGIKPKAVSYGWYAQAVAGGGKDFVKSKGTKKFER